MAYQRIQKRLLIALVILLLGFEMLGAYPNQAPFTERLDYSMRDTMLRLRGVRPADEVVIVAIDDFSFNWTGYRWPWPHAYLAQIVDAIAAGEPRVIGMDVFLLEEDEDPGGDAALAAALENAPPVVNVVQIFHDQYSETIQQPIPSLRDRFAALGITKVVIDDDAIVRGIQPYAAYGDHYYYNWAFNLAALYAGVAPPQYQAPNLLLFNQQKVPIQQGRMLINYRGPAQTFPTYSAALVVEGDVLAQNPDAFRDKIVLLGATSPTMQDVYPTPFSSGQRTPGVEIVANAVATILHNDYLRTLPPWGNLLLVLAAAFFAWAILKFNSPIKTLSGMFLGTALYLVFAWLIFIRFNTYIAMATPLLMLFLGITLPTITQAVTQEIEKRRVHAMFTRFIAPEMVDQLLKTSDLQHLNKRTELTILFSDIRGFTTLSEKLTPDEVVALLNPYLAEMTAIIHKHGGTVDKYEGDAIVAFFGEPIPHSDHARRAVRAAIEMHHALDGLRRRWQAEGRLPDHPFQVGIGLNTGDVFVGLLGSEQRINYTIIGDNANLAARIQDLTKRYKWPLLVSESTYQAAGEGFEMDYVDTVTVKGKSQPVAIYRVIGLKDAPPEEKLTPLVL